MQSTVKNRQSLLDIGMEECGAFEAAYTMSEQNDIGISSDLEVGQLIEYTAETPRKYLKENLEAKGVKPATAVSDIDEATVPYGGIGLMGIEYDFIVS